MNFVYWLSVLTAPGVVVHEFAHEVTCSLVGVEVREVEYFQRPDRGGRLGYVRHVVPRSYTKRVLIAASPFALNTVAGFAVVVAAAVYVESIAYMAVALYLGFSLLYHAFPSYGDASTLKPRSWRGYLHPAFLLFLPFTVSLLLFTRYVDRWWFSAAFAAGGVAAVVVYADEVLWFAGG